MEFVPPDDAGNTSFIKQSLSKEAGAARESTLLEAEAQVWKQSVFKIDLWNSGFGNQDYIYIDNGFQLGV